MEKSYVESMEPNLVQEARGEPNYLYFPYGAYHLAHNSNGVIKCWRSHSDLKYD